MHNPLEPVRRVGRLDLMRLQSTAPAQEPPLSARQLKQLLDASPSEDWVKTSALMEEHDIRMCRRSNHR
ncbi:MAG: hypothetical protein CL861_03530 [Cyanobium sp. MED843]|nr:hypothetical protein [Cyanobium sp. MED843]OUW29461.1 MAG: hypothetical protein CBD37_03215 [Cyanobacteria bacterium TMED177]